MSSVESADNKRKLPKISIRNAAILLMSTAFVGQLLGLLRTKLVNANFPTTGPQSTDAYFAAFTIPDFFFFTIAAGALGVAFMPVLSDRIHRLGRKSAWEFSTSLMNFLILIMFGVGLFIFLFAKPLIQHVVAPGLGPEQLDTSVKIMQLIAFNPLLFTISGVLTSVQQTMGRFFFYAVAPLFYNICIIASIFIFRDNIGLVGLGIGALFGAVAQLVIVIFGLYKLNFHWRPYIKRRDQEFNTVLSNLPPRALDQGIDQVQGVVETHIASGLGSGNITFFNNAFILATAPTLLIGSAISSAAFPRLNARLSAGRPDLFRRDFLKVLRALIWISAPVVVVSYFARGYLARLIYTNGNLKIANIFGFLCLAIFFRIIYTFISRWFYSQKDTRTPLFVSLFAISLNVFLAYTLAKPYAYGVEGLALAQSIVAVVEVALLSLVMVVRDPKLITREFWSGVWRIISATGFSVVACFIMISVYPLTLGDKGVISLGGKLLMIALVTFSVHILASWMFGLDEVKPIIKNVKRVILKPIKVQI